jgi:hypothetical protein
MPHATDATSNQLKFERVDIRQGLFWRETAVIDLGPMISTQVKVSLERRQVCCRDVRRSYSRAAHIIRIEKCLS